MHNQIMREVLVELVEAFGGSARAFASGFEYLRLARSNAYGKPCGMIVEANMTMMCGHEFMTRLQAKQPGIRFAFTSSDYQLATAVKSAACLYLPKLFRPELIGELMAHFSCSTCDHPHAGIECSCRSASPAFAQSEAWLAVA